MNILTIYINNISSLASYNEKHCTKILNSRIAYKKDPEEQENGPYKRFYEALEKEIYHHGQIHNIYYCKSDKCKKEIINCYISALSDFREKHNLNSPVCLKSEDIREIKQNCLKKHTNIIEDKTDETAIRMIYSILSTKAQSELSHQKSDH
jgi:hypothetical protein